MNSIQPLIDALAADKLGFSDLLTRLEARGAVDAATHAADIEVLNQALQAKRLPVPMHRALANKLKQIQANGPPPSAGSDETLVAPGAQVANAEIDRTLMNPIAGEDASSPSETSGSSSMSSWSKLARMEDPAVAITPGYMLKGRFMLEREVGRGGMGLVYIAKDVLKEEAQDRNPYVAVKVLNDEFRRHPDALKALQREARKSQQLNHDNIVRVYDFDRDGTTIYMTMEYVDGKELKDVIRDPSFEGMSMERAAPIIEGMGLALARAHNEGIIHSDFKPGNVLLRKDGVPKVFDFGIARAAKTQDSASGETTLFDAGSLGALTPAYASLEMLQGEDPDVRDDIYALAITSYELLTGEHPFGKKNAQKAMDAGIEPQKPVGLSRRQWRALQRGLAFHKEDRPESVEVFLTGVLGRESVLKQYQGPLIASGAAVVVVAVAIGPIARKLEQNEAEEYLAQLTAGEFENATAARTAFEALDVEARQSLVSENSDSIRQHFIQQAEAAWNPDQGQYRAPHAKQTYELLTYLLPGTVSQVFSRLQALEARKNQLLNALNDRYSTALEAGVLYPSAEAESVAEVLAIVSQMEPGHPMLSDPRIGLAYSQDIRNVLGQDDLELAQERLAVARKWIADGGELAKLESLVADRKAELEAQQRATELARLEAEKAAQNEAALRQQLESLLQAERIDGAWVASVRQSLLQADELIGADAPELAAYQSELANKLARTIAAQRDAGELDRALSLAGAGLEILPDNDLLVAERRRALDAQQARQQLAATQAERERQAKDRLNGLLSVDLFSRSLLSDIDAALADARKVLGASDPWLAEARTRAAQRMLELARARSETGAFGDAQALISKAESLAGTVEGLGAAQAQLASARDDAQRAEQARAEAKREQARKTVLAALSDPSFTPLWQRELAQAMATVGESDPQYGALQSEIVRAYVQRAQSLTATERFSDALKAIDDGLSLVSDSDQLKAQRADISQAKQVFDQRQAEKARIARVEGLKNSLLTQARADDTASVVRTLGALTKELGPSDSYIKQEARPQAIGAFQRKAKKLAAGGKVAQATATARQGLELFPGDADLEKIIRENQTSLDIELLREVAAGRRGIDSAGVRSARDRLRSAAPGEWRTLSEKIAGNLRQDILAQARNDRDGARQALAQARSFLPDSQRLAKLIIPDGSRPLVDNCKADFAGYGSRARATCYDNLPSGGRSPRMVVVPGLAGGAPFAMSKYEIAIRDYNLYCQSTGCAPLDGSIDLLPAADLSLGDIQGYIRWLNQQSGWTYRLPTEREWAHAANAGGQGPGGDFNCLLKQGAQVIKGNSAIKINVGKAGGWGLINMVGNVQEVVATGGSHVVRGGGFTDPMASCSPDLRRSWNGQSDPSIGFRIVRELG